MQPSSPAALCLTFVSCRNEKARNASHNCAFPLPSRDFSEVSSPRCRREKTKEEKKGGKEREKHTEHPDRLYAKGESSHRIAVAPNALDHKASPPKYLRFCVSTAIENLQAWTHATRALPWLFHRTGLEPWREGMCRTPACP